MVKKHYIHTNRQTNRQTLEEFNIDSPEDFYITSWLSYLYTFLIGWLGHYRSGQVGLGWTTEARSHKYNL